ncbi:COX assembly mitochondrial protein homolog isoform X2 [Chelonia mydas]|uniref:COX assembly mitochondrial protein homolog isoform X2 n=1 Tax=Chelonia mydas TaxID=8469 RepID=UPI001CA9F5BD|nr:COX assembly mitochondrial protein homolog isoform X2 [Chelonia mydas]
MEPAPGAAELRHVEKDVLIPKMMREKARELCSDKVQVSRGKSQTFIQCYCRVLCHSFYQMLPRVWLSYGGEMSTGKCSLERMSNYLGRKSETEGGKKYINIVTRNCSNYSVGVQNSQHRVITTLSQSYNDPAFYEECKIEYLKQREEFRATGIPAKQRQQKLPTSM